jgi:hypothetical protein
MKLMLEVVPNDGPGQPFLVNVVRVHDADGETEGHEDLLGCGDAPDMKAALWLGIRDLENMLVLGELDDSPEVLTETEHAYRMDAASATGMYDHE